MKKALSRTPSRENFRYSERSHDVGKPPVEPTISVIIPALNEAPNIRATLAGAKSVTGAEIIVVDGGSQDNTSRIAEGCGVQVILAPGGRARQLNAGAAKATGEILLFLHGDTLLPKGWIEPVTKTLQIPGTSAGAFRLRIDDNWKSMRVIEYLANLRSRLLELPYGDQAIFLRKEMFLQLGGFPEIPLMEDYELVRLLKKVGAVRITSQAVVTSARRWRERGALKTTLINQIMLLGRAFGVPLEELRRLYHGNNSLGHLVNETWRLLVRSGMVREALKRKITHEILGYRRDGIHRKPLD